MSDQTMKAVRFYAPGDIRVEEIPVPQPGPGEVVIKNKVTLTCGTDVKTYKRGYRYEPPFGFGHEASGVVAAVGEGVTNFKVGDRVVAAIERRAKEGDFRSNLHRGGVATVAEITLREREIAVQAAQTLGLDVAGVDILRATRGPRVMEVNASPGLEGIEKTTGIDIAGKMIEWIERQAHPGFCLKIGG